MQFRHLLLLLAVAAGVRATTVEPPTFSQLVAEADSIYRGHVTAVEARRVEGSSGAAVIKTFVTFAIDKAIKGTEQPEVVLQFLGGTVGEDTLEVSGMPHFNVGDREILFVQKNGTQFCPLVRIMHGRYRLQHEAANGRDYVARENRAPLNDVSDVQLPLNDNALPLAAARAKDTSRALSPEDFETRIASEVHQPTRQLNPR
jgi:hypothetical protein